MAVGVQPPGSLQSVGPEWQVGGVGGVEGAGTAPAQPQRDRGFGGVLADQVGELTRLQGEAAQASQALATGQATDVTQTVLAVERARLAMQLAVGIRGKLVEAYQDVYRTQV